MENNSIKLKNQLFILNKIKDNGPISRVQLQKATKLGWGTVTKCVNDFLEKEIIIELGAEKTDFGRKPINVDINTNTNYVIGMRIGRSEIRIILMNARGILIDYIEVSVNYNEEEIIAFLKNLINIIITKNNISINLLAGIGISTPGFFNNENCMITKLPDLPALINKPIKQELEKEFRVPCFLEHSNNCFALGEQQFGYGKGKKNFLSVLIGSGLSVGIVIDGKIYKGFNNSSGEFGHIPIKTTGRTCTCGSKDCLELFASGKALRMEGQRIVTENPDSSLLDYTENNSIEEIKGENIFAAANDGNDIAKEIFKEFGKSLGKGLSILINLFNPEIIIIGGKVTKSSKFFIEDMQKSIAEYSWSNCCQEIKISKINNIACIGAASYVIENMYHSNLIIEK